MARPSVLIVGAGIAGLSTAYALLKRGWEVTVLERGPIPAPVASSCDHHRITRRIYGGAEGYTARMEDAFAAWRTMWADLPGPEARYYDARGTVGISAQEGDFTDQARTIMARLDVPFELIDGPDVTERFPFLMPGFARFALLAEGGALWANTILTDLAAWLRRHGAVIRERTVVASVDHARSTAVLASGEALSADRMVVAAGVGTAALVPALGNTLTLIRTLVVYADPPPDQRAVWDRAPCWTGLGGDTDLWGMPPIDGLPLKLGNGGMGRADPTDADRDITPGEIAAMVESYVGRLRDVERFDVRWGAANYWTLAPESRFVLAEIDRSLVVSACSGHGFKFGALTGQDVARALTGEASVAQVATTMAGLSRTAQAGA